MKIALCVFFNYPFEKNIPILEDLYGEMFDHIMHIQPMVQSEKRNVYTVYRAAFNFGGYFSDSREFINRCKADYFVFAADDCLLNPGVFGRNFEKTFFRDGEPLELFIPSVSNFCNGQEWVNPHKINSMARFADGYGLYNQRVEGWQSYLPASESIVSNAGELGHYSFEIGMPNETQSKNLTGAQLEVASTIMRGRESSPLPYPLVYAPSDFFIVSKTYLDAFCHHVGLLATMNVFSEVAVPTALLSLQGKITQALDLGLAYEWTWGRNANIEQFVPKNIKEVRDFLNSMDNSMLFKHPIKLSKIEN